MRPESSPENALAQLMGRKLAAGAASRNRFQHLLGLDTTGGRCEIEALAWTENRLEVTCRAETQSLVLCVEARGNKDPSYLTTDQLAIWYQGSVLPKALDEALSKWASQRLKGLGLAELAELLTQDPELGSRDLPMPIHDDFNSPTRGHLHSWGASEVYADFFAHAELVRHQLDSLDLFMKTTCIQHSDMECMCVAPVHGAPIVTLVSFPWSDRFRRHDHRGEPDPFEPTETSAAAMWTTGLTERDVLLGNPGKISAVLDQAMVNPVGGLILFSNTCIPMVTGEDVESVVREYRERSSVPLLYLTVSSKSMKHVLSEVLIRRRMAAEAQAAATDPRTVNLIGFPRTHATAALLALLEEVGIRVNEILVPSVDPSAIDNLPRGALNVTWPNALWQNVYDQVQWSSIIPAITPPAPFGFQGTRRWLLAIGEVLGLRERADNVWHRSAEALQDRWSALTQQATGQRLCFVARSSQIEWLTEPAYSWGVPLLECAEEMGFGIDVLIHVRGRQSARLSARAVQQVFSRPADHSIRAFDSPELMMKRLSESRAQAVFSQHFFDWRVTAAGKIPFSLMHFEHGLEGAILTLERLLGLCKTPFFRRFHPYLQRTSDGRRSLATPRHPAHMRGKEGQP